MNLSFLNISRNRLNRPLPVDPETGFYSRNYFLIRLKEERDRSKRSGIPFSLMLLDVNKMSKALKEKGLADIGYVLQKKLTDELIQQTRSLDIKGWFDLQRAGVLMPGTGHSGAVKVKNKVYDHLSQRWQELREIDPQREFIQVFTFGKGTWFDKIVSDIDEDRPRGGMEIPAANAALHADVLSRNPSSLLKIMAKRLMDICGSLLGIAITLLPMAVIAFLTRLTSPGPAFFRQERIGFSGRKFSFMKFRSMHVDSDESVHEKYVAGWIAGDKPTTSSGTKTPPIYKISNDSRITPFGRFLRRTSLDELPQLFNVLKGEMSLVGPRPDLPYSVKQYQLWHTGRMFEVKPGLTGLWQVSGRGQTTFDDMVRLDLRYANNWSPWLDIKIILKTVRAIFSKVGAY